MHRGKRDGTRLECSGRTAGLTLPYAPDISTGIISDSSLSDCHVDGGSVSGDDSQIVGFAGQIARGTISDSTADIDVTGEADGGFIGKLAITIW